MQLSEIQAFLAVIQYGSFSQAAEQLFITQPTLTHRIQSLESELETVLFIRKKGQKIVEVTESGKAFIRTAEKWTLLWEESKRAVSTVPREKLRIAATQTLSNYVMPDVYAHFLSRNFPVDLELYSLHYKEGYEAIENRDVDLVIVSRTLSSNRVSAINIFSEKMVLLCRKDSPYQDPVIPSELPVEKCIYMIWNHEYSLWHECWFGSGQAHVYADNMRLVEKIISTTDMWAIVPISAARAICRDAAMHFLPISDNAPPDRPINLLTLEPQSIYAKYIVEDLRTVMQG